MPAEPTKPRQLTQDQERECHRADETIRDIATLAQIPEFRRFMERVAAGANKMAGQVLNDEMTGKERREMRLKRRGIMDVLDMPALIRKGSISILKSYGRPIPHFPTDPE